MTQFITSPTEPAAVACPRCKSPLIDPNGLGWCKKCGYCRSLAESEMTPAEKPVAHNTLTATSSAIGQTPTWVWVTLIGIGLVAGGTYALGSTLQLSAFARALLATIVIVAGSGLMFAGQFIALLKIAPEDPSLTFKDALFPFRLYGLVVKHLPSTKYTVFLGTWGAALIITSVVFIGGLGHWFTYAPGYQKAQAAKAAKK